MDFENKLESPHSTSPNPSVLCDSSKAQPSHKRKAGRKKFKETRHPVYRGVRQRNGNKWVCEIREPNNKSRIWLGTYPTPEMAARAHDVAVLALKGTSATFNFPDSIFLLPVPKSCSAKDIRAAASKLNTTTTTDVPFKQNAAFCSSLDHNNNFVGKINVMEDMSMMHGVDDDDDGCKAMFLDEEALYNMPGLLDSMAEGLLITPPSMTRAMDWEDIGCEVDLTLWTD